MNRFVFSFIIFSALVSNLALSQKIASLEVGLSKATNGLDQPISIELDAISALPSSAIQLVEIDGNKQAPILFQIDGKEKRHLTWIVKAGDDKIRRRVYELQKRKNVSPVLVEAKVNDGAVIIENNNKKLLQYNFKTIYPPVGIDTAFKRSAFIHPLWTPHGQPLTRIQAPDHYHHYGIWNPWTHVLFEGDTVDFWNLKDRKGTVRFNKFTNVTSGPVYSEVKALHEHVVFKKNGTEKVALNELQTVRVYGGEKNQDYYFVDIKIELTCATQSPFLILEYRYAGLGWRATEKWNKSNCEVLTSEGKTRNESDGTTARWVIVQGALDNDYGGAVMMSSPSNYNYPEPLRIWPDGTHGGEMFAMFAPTKTKDWQLVPGQTYTLNYRFCIYNGHFTREKAESAWQYFGVKTDVQVKRYK